MDNAYRNEHRIGPLIRLGKFLQEGTSELDRMVREAGARNPWFTPVQVYRALRNIRDGFLEESVLVTWIGHYPLPERQVPMTVGLVMAGNIPLVGFHDFLCVYASGHHARIKLSDKDPVLLPFLLEVLASLGGEPAWDLVDRLSGFDAVIATGSNNSARYFHAYFDKVPHVIRKNRNGVAILTGRETEDQWMGLSEDVLTYFGLGCRNVSKLLVPPAMDLHSLLRILDDAPEIQDHHRYRNNLDYQTALALMNGDLHLTNGHILLKASDSLLSPVASLHFEVYRDHEDLLRILDRDREGIQCLVGDPDVPIPGWDLVPFGQTQSPGPDAYPDGVDIMAFLNQLNSYA